MRKRMGILLDLEGERVHQICGFMWADNFGIMLKPPSMSVANAAEDSPSFQPPYVLVPPLPVTALVGVPHCSDSYMFSIWDR